MFLPMLMSLPKTKTTRDFLRDMLKKGKISKNLLEKYLQTE